MLKEKFEKQKIVLGSWVQLACPSVCEIAARQGLDWIAVDLEHTEIGYEMLCNMFRGLNGSQTASVVRVRSNDELDIRRALDIGAKGILVPLINTARAAERAVRSCKYPPGGVRGYAFCRANGWGADFDRYAQEANEDIMVFVMIESREGVENIDEILAVDGLDGVFIGPYDMSASYGVVGKTGHPLVTEGCQRVLEACLHHGKIPGIHIVNPDPAVIADYVEKGFRLIAVGIDAVFITRGLREAIQTAQAAADRI